MVKLRRGVYMVNSISSISSCISSDPHEEKPAEVQAITSVALQALEREQEIKNKLKGLFCFDKLCELGRGKGATFTDDGNFIVDPSGKRLVADLKSNHTLIKEAFCSHIEAQGYSYNPVTELLTNGTIDTIEETLEIIKIFFNDKVQILSVAKKLNDVTLGAIYSVIDFEEIKSTIIIFMNSRQFVTLLRNRGWAIQGTDKNALFLSPRGKIFNFQALSSKWKKLKSEVIQSIHDCGYPYNAHYDCFVYQETAITMNEVYDLIEYDVIDQLIIDAYSIGIYFDITSKGFVKNNLKISLKEVVTQVTLKHMGLEDIH